MPWFVNGQPVPEELISQEETHIARHPGWLQIADEGERARRIRANAERSAQDKILIAQAAAADLRPIDPALIQQHLARLKQNANGSHPFDESAARQAIDLSLRIQRFIEEATAGAPEPTAEESEAFYRANRENFRGPERFRAAHIVKHVTQEQSAEQAEAGIALALAELGRGDPFAEVAERHSDCKGKGGDLGEFPAGEMVEQFEEAIRALDPGQRTGIFTTPFGFHIAELRAKIPPGAATFEDVRTLSTRISRTPSPCVANTSATCAPSPKLRAHAEIRFVAEEQ